MTTEQVTDKESVAIAPRTLKELLESGFRKAPILRESADPVVAGILWLVIVLAAVGVALAGSVLFPADKDGRSHIIQLAGGVLVLLGAYFTARNLIASQAQQYAERLRATIGDLASPSPAVRRAAVLQIEAMAYESSGLPGNAEGRRVNDLRKRALCEALATSSVGDGPERDVAEAACSRVAAHLYQERQRAERAGRQNSAGDALGQAS